MQLESIEISLIQPEDSQELGELIKRVLEEMNAPKKGTAYADPYLFDLFSYYNHPKRDYYVIRYNGELLGGGGYGDLPGAPEEVCEIQKMYFDPKLRGKGIGKRLLLKLIEESKRAGYTKAYIETLPQMKSAIGLYEHLGFTYLDGPLGGTGHTSCPIHLILEI